jgi:hypothetical protein
LNAVTLAPAPGMHTRGTSLLCVACKGIRGSVTRDTEDGGMIFKMMLDQSSLRMWLSM